MLGIGRDELFSLTESYKEKHINKILYAAMEGKIKLYVLHIMADTILPLSPEQIEAIVINYPEGVEIESEAFDKYFNPHRVRQWTKALIEKKISSFGVNNLLINKREADIFIKGLKIINDDKQVVDVNKYSTPLIALMNKAIEEFWINHDPRKPPKSEIIKKWLEQQGVARRVAEAIDTIIRPEIYKKGGNKSQIKGVTLGQKK